MRELLNQDNERHMKAFRVAKAMPLDIGILHFVGIGGIGMSGIAELLHNLGYKVQGSDLSDNANARRLRDLGIHVMVGHKADNIGDAAVVVKSTAVSYDNPEIMAARAAQIPVVKRSEMLNELMRLKMSIAVAGTHGKTTTTSIIASILAEASMDPTIINGGVINAYGTNVHLGEGDWIVAEADESDGTFLKIPACVAVVTNMDPEHLDYYGSYDNLKQAFRDFVERIPFYGFAVMCIDHPEVQALASRITDRRIIRYGTSPQANVRAVNITGGVDGSTFDVILQADSGEETKYVGMTFPIPGEHNIRNSLAAIGVARELGISEDVIRRALSSFSGVKRRFTKTGKVSGITIIDDYGHHPTEIAATLKAAREFRSRETDRIIAVVQPHRYTRLRDLFDAFCSCMNDADIAIISDVYAAGEQPIDGFDRDHLVEGLRNGGHKQVIELDAPDQLADIIAAHARSGDIVVCLGAGSVTQWAYALPDELSARLPDIKLASSS